MVSATAAFLARERAFSAFGPVTMMMSPSMYANQIGTTRGRPSRPM